MYVLFFLVGLSAMLVGLVSLVKPLSFLRIRSRKVGAVVLGAGFLAVIVGVLIVPPFESTDVAGEVTAQPTTTGEAATTTIPSTIRTPNLTGLVPLPGDTVASQGLQVDVLEVLLGLEATSGCDQSVVTDTRIVDVGSDRAEEEWLVDRCGVTVPWTVEFRENESGGSDFTALPSAEVSSLRLLVDSGGWEGMTSQGEKFLLILEERAVTYVAVGFDNPTCPDDSPMSIQFGSPKHYLVGNTFALVEPGLYNLTLTGAFRDDDSALGTLRVEPPSDCGAVIEATWEATPTG
jgi:hypothetical protein